MQLSDGFTMEQPQHMSSTTTTRYGSQQTSSAFSASANANEDWTKISDLAERRRIQNRIAQRNYRKKLKRRLEDLERKASSTSASPEPQHAEIALPTIHKHSHRNSHSSAMARQASSASKASSTFSHDQQQSPEIFPLDDPFGSMTMSEQRLQYLSPPTYAYSSYGHGSDYFSNEFAFPMTQSIPQMYTEPQLQADYSHSLPPTLPPMQQSDVFKQDPFVVDDDYLNPFGISYATLANMDLKQQFPASYQPRTPPSSGSWSSNASRENSPPLYHQPMTPISRSTSPNVQFFDHSWQC